MHPKQEDLQIMAPKVVPPSDPPSGSEGGVELPPIATPADTKHAARRRGDGEVTAAKQGTAKQGKAATPTGVSESAGSASGGRQKNRQHLRVRHA